jgi:hypothetical protein
VAQSPAVEAKVPFDFTVGSQLLPADTYIISSDQFRVTTIKGVDRHSRMVTIASPSNRESVSGSKLVFKKYGNEYFLSEILCPTSSMNLQLPESKLEKQVQTQEARSGGRAEVGLVASR